LDKNNINLPKNTFRNRYVYEKVQGTQGLVAIRYPWI